jgi:uracil phosphoribosyltransferase
MLVSPLCSARQSWIACVFIHRVTDRLSSLVVETGLSMIPYRDATVTTPLDLEFKGMEVAARDIVGVSVLRS